MILIMPYKNIKYADDTIIYTASKVTYDVQNKLNTDIVEVYRWLTENDLSLNLKKGETETKVFGK